MKSDHSRASGERRVSMPARGYRPGWLAASLQLVAVVGFALVVPLLSALSSNATLFAVHAASPAALVLLAVGIAVIPAATAVGLSLLVRRLAPRSWFRFHSLLVALIGAFAVAPLLWSVASHSNAAGILLLGIIAVVIKAAYDYLPAIRDFLTFASAAPVLALAFFLFASPMVPLIWPEPPVAAAASASSTDVVLLVFDEFSLPLMLDESGEIDEERFPNFSRLASTSTWYPNATTVANSTAQAVPALLTGQMPRDSSAPPGIGVHPGNLFTLLAGPRRVVAWEWVTSMCPDECEAPQRYDTGAMLRDVSLLFFNRVLPPPAAEQKATIPADRWGHLGRDRECEQCEVDEFLSAVEEGSDPSLWYFHAALPHSPWSYTPEGFRYSSVMPDVWTAGSSGWSGDADYVHHAMQRYLLQARYADAQLGRVWEHLTDRGLLDDAVVVVVSDHGLVWEPGHERRLLPEVDIRADLLSVPLFIRYPGQTVAVADSRVAQLTDVLPTLADVLQIEIPWRVDGTSLQGPEPESDRRAFFDGDAHELFGAVEGVDRRQADVEATFGTGGRPHDVYAFGPFGHLVGTRLADLGSSESLVVDAEVSELDRFSSVDRSAGDVPIEVRGRTAAAGDPVSRWMAVAVNGRIAGVGKTWVDGDTESFSILVDPVLVRDGENELLVVDARSVADRSG